MFDKLAEELKEARLKNNLTIKQLAAKTRIDIKFIEAIEEGNFSFLPELYVKAFLKEYANVVGLDQDKILKKYELSKEGLPYEDEITEKSSAEPEKKTEEKPDEKKEESKSEINQEKKIEDIPEKFREVKHSAHQSNSVYSQPVPTFDSTANKKSDLTPDNKNIIIVASIIGGAIVLIGLIYLIFFTKSNEIVVAEKPYDEVVAETQQRYEETSPAKSDSVHNSSVSSDSLNLLIQTKDTSWVKIIFDNSSEEEFILFPNSQKSLKAADNFKITFGRSSAIKLQLNNKPLEFNPKSKSVSYVLINSQGLKFLEKPPQAGQD